MGKGTPEPGSIRVAILGGGAIGLGMAAAITEAGGWVDLVDSDAAVREAAHEGVEAQFPDMRVAGHSSSSAGEALSRLGVAAGLDGVHSRPSMVIEAATERLEVKRALFARLLRWTGGDVPVASTSSALTVSAIVDAPADQAWCLNAHCINPPAIIRAIECVPACGTLPEAMDRAAGLLAALGFQPVRLHREIPAFVANRLQGALLREAYRLVGAGVIGVEGLDRLVVEALGPRWALSGPFETAELNTRGGIRGHAARMGPAYRAIGEEIGERDAGWSDELVDEVVAQRRALLPEAELPARVAWRRQALARLMAARRAILADGPESGDG